MKKIFSFIWKVLFPSGVKAGMFVRILGYALLIFGVVNLLYRTFFLKDTVATTIGEFVALNFFIIMLGISLIFPSLLQDHNQGLSTMRFTVFMMTNIICLLLLKLGWNAPSLNSVGLDEYWMGMIAFIFGAKAAQTYFERKNGEVKEEKVKEASGKIEDKPAVGMSTVEFSNAELAKLAVIQNEQYLKLKFPNILSVSDAVHDLNNPESHVVALYLKDDKVEGIPDKLEIKMPNGSVRTIGVELVKNMGIGEIHISQRTNNVSDISSSSYLGSICCKVKSTTNPDFVGIVTSGHIYSNGYLRNMGGILSNEQQKDALIDQTKSGKWFLQIINNQQDLAVVKLDNDSNSDSQYQSFAAGYYTVSDNDINQPKPNVTIISKGNKIRDAFIIDYNIALDINYHTETIYMNKIILIGSNPNRDKSQSLSEGGDSGSCVYEKSTMKLIGMLLGGNNRFSFILPIEKTLEYYNLKPI
jgi:hypothetical protein